MRVWLAISVGERIRMFVTSLRINALPSQVVVTPHAGKNLPGLMGVKEDLETSAVRVSNQTILPAEKQRIGSFY